MSDRNSSLWPIVHTVLLAGVLLAAVTVTCSNSRLEGRVIALQKAIEARPGGGGSIGGSGGGGDAASPVAAVRVPGQGSGVRLAGWNGKVAEVTFVEGAVENAPLRLEDKPRPQGDWYVTRRGSPPRNLNYYITSEGETSTVTQ
ncbi:MAG: hypothetical protein K8T90_11215 [Planctomycetes bacterium]|nr:hypothetical protein [Planctomycetota bacterium]